MRSSISSDRARSFTFRTVCAYYSNVMQAVWPRLALRSYGEGANMANMALPVAGSRVNTRLGDCTPVGVGKGKSVQSFHVWDVRLNLNVPSDKRRPDLAGFLEHF